MAPSQSTKRFSEKDLETVQSSEEEQKKFKNLVATRKEYSETEKAVVKFATVAEFDAYWQKTNDAKEKFEQSHERGCGLCSKTYQSSAVVVRNFMKDFSPILDIVQNFAAPYGGMAVGTISVLFVVAANKEETEETLASTITAIQDRLPGLNLYQHIYNENHELDMKLQARIVSAYQHFIDFCIEASKFYKGGGPRRWLRALGRPNSILDKAKMVQEIIVDIRRLCDELLDKNVHSIKQLNIGKAYQEQTATIKTLDGKVRQLQEAQDDNTLTEIQRLLSLSDFSDETQSKGLNQHRDALNSDEELNAAYFEQMGGPRLDEFKASTDYLTWTKSEQPCLLILSGYNDRSIANLDKCWVSPVAIDLIMDLRHSSGHPIFAYYVFDPKGELLYRALAVILLQLLRRKRQVLRDKPQSDELRAELYNLGKNDHRDKEAIENEDERLSALQKVALRVVGFFNESETVHVVLDRVDQCCDLRKNIDHRKPLLKVLVKMIEAARCKLRVLVVINGHQWSIEQRRDELEEKINGRIIVYKAEQKLSDSF